jgi:AAT family amino acid transporter
MVMQTKAEKGYGFNYLLGMITFVGSFLLVWLLWYVFMNPNAVLKLYTPMYGFALVVFFVAAILLVTHVAYFYPFGDPSSGQRSLGQGVLLTLICIGVMLLLFFGVFWGFLGRLGIAYFSPKSIVAGGGVGAEFFVARENACTAMIYYMTAFVWMAIFWKAGFGRWPWGKASASVAAWSRFFTLFFFVNIIYVVFFHPHVCSLFYPAQDKAGVLPWWDEAAGTGSAFVWLGLIICIIYWLITFEELWEGAPFHRLEKNGEPTFAKGLIVFIASVLFGILMVYVLTRIFNVFWDEPFVGGQYTDGTDFRFIHTGEIAGLFILAAFILKNYFNNFPNFGNIWIRAAARTIISMAFGLLFYAFYYSPLATFFLAKVSGIAQPGDTPFVWTFLYISIIMVHGQFFNTWPLKTAAKD